MTYYRMQLWWGDGWSFGTRFARRADAEACAAEHRAHGWTVRVVCERTK
jgi:hypothetical protein